MAQRLDPFKRFLDTPERLRHALNVWPTFLACGVRVRAISDDWRRVVVVLKKGRLNSNYFGTQFGGTMFSMVDPFFAIMVYRCLNTSGSDEYVVWDRAGEIDFISPGHTDLRAELVITESDLDELRAASTNGAKVLHWFSVDLVDTHGTAVATVRKQIYVRRKRSNG